MKIILITGKEISCMKAEIDEQLNKLELGIDINAAPGFSDTFKEALATAICSGNTILAFAAYEYLKNAFCSNFVFRPNHKISHWEFLRQWVEQTTSDIGKGCGHV